MVFCIDDIIYCCTVDFTEAAGNILSGKRRGKDDLSGDEVGYGRFLYSSSGGLERIGVLEKKGVSLENLSRSLLFMASRNIICQPDSGDIGVCDDMIERSSIRKQWKHIFSRRIKEKRNDIFLRKREIFKQ